MILIDTGPLVALFDPRDGDFAGCHKVLNTISEPLYTTEAVLTEALHMLEPGTKGEEGLKVFFLEDYVALESLEKTLLARCFELMDKYADIPMDFADATLVALAEKRKINNIFTLDFKDFAAYRYKKGYRYETFRLVGSRELAFSPRP